jgi:hypothetical protein
VEIACPAVVEPVEAPKGGDLEIYLPPSAGSGQVIFTSAYFQINTFHPSYNHNQSTKIVL